MGPTDAVIAVTWRCNCRCAMCNIWRLTTDGQKALWPDSYRRLPASLRDVNISGGEPFLRDDLEEIVAAVHEACPRARLIISTNGVLSRRIRQGVRRMVATVPQLGVAVSIDGAGEMHDRIRGLPGAFEKARHTIDLLQRDGFTNLRLAFTTSQENVDHLGRVYDLACELGVEFTCAVAHASEHYFHSAEAGRVIVPRQLREQVDYVIKRQLKGFSPKRWARAYFLDRMAEFNAGMGRPFPCRAGVDTFFLSPEGEVYPCNVLSAKIGNIEDMPFDDLWRSPAADKARGRAGRCRHGCWMVCSARTAMRQNWWRVLGWCLRRKFFGSGGS